eukprot:5693582-Amphidinium_carterae.2
MPYAERVAKGTQNTLLAHVGSTNSPPSSYIRRWYACPHCTRVCGLSPLKCGSAMTQTSPSTRSWIQPEGLPTL